MKFNTAIVLVGILVSACLLKPMSKAADADELDLNRVGRGIAKPIPIALSGFSGEVASVLGFDLYVCGFEVVSGNAAQYAVNGSNNGQVQGELRDVVTKQSLFNNRY